MSKQGLSAAKKEWLLVTGLMAIFLLLYVYNGYLSHSLVKHGVIVQGEVTDALVAPKRGKLAYFDFGINGKQHFGSWFLPAFKNINDRYVIVGYCFPLVVDTTNSDNNKMLFDSVNFREYGLTYPDSMRWLKKFLK